MYAGIDPGREKFGWALVKSGGSLLLSGIAPRPSFGLWIDTLAAGKAKGFDEWVCERNASDATLPPCRNILLGEGTGMKEMAENLRERGAAFETVPEAYSTLRARKLYWMLHPPHGLVRVVPLAFRVPPRPVDDLAAWRLVLDYLGFPGEGMPHPARRD
ncbi:MAG: endonuclease [Thermovirgaceae bacterium]